VGKPLKIAVGIASLGRSAILSDTICVLAEQTRPPDQLVISISQEEDLDAGCLRNIRAATSVVTSAVGSCAQRNRILSEIADADVVVFFDDDFFACRDYLSHIERIFESFPDVMAVTGRPIEDGINGPGLAADYARSLLARTPEVAEAIAETVGTYGCNMAYRLLPIQSDTIRFDENLPLYGWQEDVDFSAQVGRHGRIIESNLLKGVHLGIKRARSSGLRLGYSQIANPIYLTRKGTMPWSYALNLIARNMTANLIRTLRPEPWIDRRGRLRGNVLALADLVLRRDSPQRILQLQ
jgi:polysaccharide biosynthesis transport protein